MSLLLAATDPAQTDYITLGGKLILGALGACTAVIVAFIQTGRHGQKRENAAAVYTASLAKVEATEAKNTAATAASNAELAAQNTVSVSNGRIPRIEAKIDQMLDGLADLKARQVEHGRSIEGIRDDQRVDRARLNQHLDRP